MTTPAPNLPVNEPLTGYVGEVGGRSGEDQGIFRASQQTLSGDLILSTLARGSAIVVLLMLVALVGVLFVSSLPSIEKFGAGFFVQKEWQPNEREIHHFKLDANGNKIVKSKVFDDDSQQWVKTYEETVEVQPPTFGALSAIYGTIVSSALALVVAVPLSFGAALFLVRIGAWLSPTFVKCGVVGLLLTVLLAGMGWPSWLWTALGAAFGLAVTGALLYLAWRVEDPRIGPRPVLEIGIVAGVVIIVVLFGLFILRESMIVSVVAGALAALLVHLLASSIVGILSFLIEFLAAIPSIAYGIWGVLVLSHFLGDHVEPTGSNGRDMLSAALILAIMILPIITAISRDVLKAMPRIQIEGTQALGATWWQSSWEMLRYGRSGLFGAVILGLARAAGETMAVLMIMPPETRISVSLFKPVATMAELIASQFSNVDQDIQRSALTEIALVLLLMSLAFNVLARYLVVGGQRTAA